jgi:hypothetical protein
MPQGLEIPFDRVTWRDGQLLAASDMQDDQTRISRLWQLHTRYMHETWGIAIGFEVSLHNGDSVVQVGPGYAVDEQGRPLVSSQTVPVAVPLVAGTEYQVLVIGYQSDAAFRDRVGLDLLCLGGGPDVRQESPTFSWKAPSEVRMGADVPLITAQVSNGQIQTSDTRARRYVQKLLRPYIAAGATDQGSTQWTAQANSPSGFTLYRVAIDTTDNAFNDTPFYFPELHMWNGAPLSVYGVTNTSPSSDFADFGGPYAFLTSASRTGFNFNLLVPSAGQAGNMHPVADPNLSQWTVSWVGIEVATCEPQFHLLIGILLNFTRFFPKFLGVKIV